MMLKSRTETLLNKRCACTPVSRIVLGCTTDTSLNFIVKRNPYGHQLAKSNRQHGHQVSKTVPKNDTNGSIAKFPFNIKQLRNSP
ncbi:hypothetical protein TNCV_4694511 [Trichonephila clavipes]|nr:hypothetical protein TNCV_4694511 [Trichonephila clavipes]